MECGLLGPPWRQQSALKGSELRPRRVLPWNHPSPILCPLQAAWPAFYSCLPS